MDFGSPDLILPPTPPLFQVVQPNPYLDPDNPPLQPDVS